MTQPTDRCYKATLRLEEIDLTTGRTLAYAEHAAGSCVRGESVSDVYAVIEAVETATMKITAGSTRERLEKAFFHQRGELSRKDGEA